MSTIFEEIEKARVAAEDMMSLRLKAKIDKAEENIRDVNEKLQNPCTNVLPEIRRLDLCAKKEILVENMEMNKNLLDKSDKISKQKFRQCVKRLATKLIKENRMSPKHLLMEEDVKLLCICTTE